MEELHSVDEHFRGRSPAVREIYDSILAVSRKLGGFKEEAKKTSIHLVNRTAFAGIQTRREYLILTFKSDQDIDSDRIIKREHVSANRW